MIRQAMMTLQNLRDKNQYIMIHIITMIPITTLQKTKMTIHKYQ